MLTSRHMAGPYPLVIAAAMALVATMARPAHAWEPLDDCRPTWETTPSPYYVNSAGYSVLSMNQIRDIFERAFEEWAEPCCSGFSGVELGLTDRVGEDGSASENIFSFREDSWPAELGDPSSVLAVTLTRYVPTRGGGCRDLTADMVFNAANNRFATSEGRTTVDLLSVTTHEVGHWLGLDHSRVNAATMWFSYIGEEGRSLHPDDEAGVCTLYPDTCECESAADCEPGEECIDSECVEAPCRSDADCAVGLECDVASGECIVPPCRTDADCPGSQICDTVTGECIIEADCPTCLPCTGDEDCGGRPWQCVSNGIEGFCTRVCASAEECPGNSDCFSVVGEGFAICLNENANDALCPDDYVCVEGDDPGGLCDDVVCEPGEVCDPATGNCVRDNPDDDCVICDDCFDDGDCPGATCWGFGDRSICASDCTTDADCPVTSECTAFSIQGGGTVQLCVNENSDVEGVCPADYECGVLDDLCEGVVCDADQICDADTGDCIPDPDAPIGRGGACDVCDPCRDDADCEGGCFVLGDAGAVCTLPCESNDDCPFNTECFELPDGEGGALTLCLNDTASGSSVCQADWVCEEPVGGDDTGGSADAGGGGSEVVDSGGEDAAPINPGWFGGAGTGDSGGCAAARAGSVSWWALGLLGITRRRRRIGQQ